MIFSLDDDFLKNSGLYQNYVRPVTSELQTIRHNSNFTAPIRAEFLIKYNGILDISDTHYELYQIFTIKEFFKKNLYIFFILYFI